MSLLVITINDPGMPSKSAEIAYAQRAVEIALLELSRSRDGSKTSGTIVGVSNAGTPNTSLGSWTYTPSATRP